MGFPCPELNFCFMNKKVSKGNNKPTKIALMGELELRGFIVLANELNQLVKDSAALSCYFNLCLFSASATFASLITLLTTNFSSSWKFDLFISVCSALGVTTVFLFIICLRLKSNCTSLLKEIQKRNCSVF